jgi:hypothetical protein
MQKRWKSVLLLLLMPALAVSLLMTTAEYVGCQHFYPDECLDFFGIPSVLTIVLFLFSGVSLFFLEFFLHMEALPFRSSSLSVETFLIRSDTVNTPSLSTVLRF